MCFCGQWEFQGWSCSANTFIQWCLAFWRQWNVSQAWRIFCFPQECHGKTYGKSNFRCRHFLVPLPTFFQKAPCENTFRAITNALVASTSCDITGIVAIACAWHGCYVPNSIVDVRGHLRASASPTEYVHPTALDKLRLPSSIASQFRTPLTDWAQHRTSSRRYTPRYFDILLSCFL